jgi:hypothetical protein
VAPKASLYVSEFLRGDTAAAIYEKHGFDYATAEQRRAMEGT